MSLLERVSPLHSPSSKSNCSRGYFQVPNKSNGVDSLSESAISNVVNDSDLDTERSFYNRRNKYPFTSDERTKSPSSSQILKDDSYLQGYINKKDMNRKVLRGRSYFPAFEKLQKDQFYSQYIRQQNNKSSPSGDKFDIQERYQQQKIIIENKSQKERADSLADDQKNESSNNNWQSRSPHVQILTPKLHSDEAQEQQQDESQIQIIPIISSSINLPRDFIDCSIDHLITLISRMLKSLIVLNDSNVPTSISSPQSETDAGSNNGNNRSSVLTRYHSRTPPSISIPTYLSRLTKFNNFTTATLLTTIYYIDLLSHHYQPFFTLNSWTVHRFLLVGTMLSQKSMEDFFYTNDHYAKVGGVAVSELNCLELDFLSRVDWKCIPAKHLENGKSSIKYAKDVLDLYYAQLIQLMGKNVSKDDHNYFEAGTQNESDVNSGQKGTMETSDSQIEINGQDAVSEDEEIGEREEEGEEDEGEDDEGDDYDNYDSDEEIEYQRSPEAFPASASRKGSSTEEAASAATLGISYSNKFDVFGYSIDGSSSPHLKRRFSIQSED
ncbi:hypothetical protein CLIB1423_04S04896 [[Candida] railenensis]|uniref:Uncharacterized protein n=1 Tax=[Candida] railenensis TaxID=45579 RepID=A0A9P0VXR2_9ASCO|nr:hypothetical protein CLIB1423_04S04896 [[Candida] railenensis]